MFREMFSTSERSAEDAILKLAKNAEDAQAIVAYLSTVDWHQAISERMEEKRVRVSSYMEDVQENWLTGGGYCDECREQFTKLFYWPFASHNSEKKEFSLPHPWQVIAKEGIKRTPAEIGKILNELVPEWQRKHDEWQASQWNETHEWCFHRFCWKCLYKQQDAIHVPYERRLYRCSICDRLTRSRYKIESKKETIYCCLHCVEQAAEKQFSFCQECGKKTANILPSGICYDCRVISPYQWQVSSQLSRARAAGTPATLTTKEWAATVTYFGGKCAYCKNRPFEALEHFFPIILGGGTTADNCVPACHECNSRKGSMHPERLTSLFSHEVIEHIKQYLQGDKQQIVSPYVVNSRALLARG